MKSKTNWHLIIWPILTLWLVLAAYVFTTEWRESANVLLPLLMVATAILVLLLHAITGSVTQRRNELSHLDSTCRCMACGQSEGPLRIVDYQSYIFLGAILVQTSTAGKFCIPCSKTRIESMFRRTLWGCILCPPIILWAFIQRGRVLRKLV